jgi:hypothetical protein
MAVHVVVLAGLVMAVTLLVFTNRALTFRVDALEAARARSESGPAPRATFPPTDMNLSRSDTTPPPSEPSTPETTRPAETKPAPEVAAVEGQALTPSQEQAVARAVDRILKEKYGHLPKVANPEDIEKTLEKELSLSASQKARISDLLKQKREELRALFEGDEAGKGLPVKKGMEIERRYDAAIKNELDATQQAKYDQLKKEGKIPAGLVVQIEAGDGSQKEDIEIK